MSNAGLVVKDAGWSPIFFCEDYNVLLLQFSADHFSEYSYILCYSLENKLEIEIQKFSLSIFCPPINSINDNKHPEWPKNQNIVGKYPDSCTELFDWLTIKMVNGEQEGVYLS